MYNQKPLGYYLDEIDKYYKKCYHSCESCDEKGYGKNHHCLTCNIDYNLTANNSNYLNCYIICPYYHFIDENDNKTYCTLNESCTKDYPYLINDKNECIKNNLIITDLIRKEVTNEITNYISNVVDNKNYYPSYSENLNNNGNYTKNDYINYSYHINFINHSEHVSYSNYIDNNVYNNYSSYKTITNNIIVNQLNMKKIVKTKYQLFHILIQYMNVYYIIN